MGGAIAAATRVALSFELNMVALVQLLEDSFFDARRMKEQFLAPCVPNEAVASITNDSRIEPDSAMLRHPFCSGQDNLSRAWSRGPAALFHRLRPQLLKSGAAMQPGAIAVCVMGNG